MSGWIICEYDDDGEIINPEWVYAPDDSFWWVNSLNKLDKVCRKDEIWFRPTKIARVAHPAQPQVPEGYALVPIEPTASMLFYASTINRPHDLCREIYRDMIAGHTHPEAVLTASQEQPK